MSNPPTTTLRHVYYMRHNNGSLHMKRSVVRIGFIFGCDFALPHIVQLRNGQEAVSLYIDRICFASDPHVLPIQCVSECHMIWTQLCFRKDFVELDANIDDNYDLQPCNVCNVSRSTHFFFRLWWLSNLPVIITTFHQLYPSTFGASANVFLIGFYISNVCLWLKNEFNQMFLIFSSKNIKCRLCACNCSKRMN